MGDASGTERKLFAELSISVLLVAPLVFALMTWQRDYSFLALRYYSFPIVTSEFFVVLFALLGGARPFTAIRSARPLTLVVAGVWLTVAIFASTVIARGQPDGRIFLTTTLIHAALAVVLWDMFRHGWREMKRPMLRTLAVGTALYVVLIYGLAFSVRNDPDFNWVHFGPGVSHVRHIGYYGGALVGLSAGLLASTMNRSRVLEAAGLFTIGFAVIDWTGTRGAFVAAIFASIVVLALCSAERRRSVSSIMLASFILAIPLSLIFVPPNKFWGFWRIFSRLDKLDLNYVSTNRLLMWKTTLPFILDRPWFGHGEGQFRLIVSVLGRRYNHPHNSVLQFLFQWGIVGTMSLVFLLIEPLRHTVRKWRRADADSLPAVGGLTAICANSLIDGTLFYAFPVMVAVISLSVLASIETPDATGFESRRSAPAPAFR